MAAVPPRDRALTFFNPSDADEDAALRTATSALPPRRPLNR